jgi:hypothetical protein
MFHYQSKISDLFSLTYIFMITFIHSYWRISV